MKRFLSLLICLLPFSGFGYSWVSFDYQETLASNGTTRYFRLSYPDDFTYVRGIFVNFNAASGDTRAEYLKPYFKEWLRLHQFAFIGSWKLDVAPGSSQALIVFTNSIASFATQSGHPEINNAPLVMFVHSGGSGPAWITVKTNASQVIAWADGSGAVGAPPIIAPAGVLPIPVLMWAGDTDVTGVANAMESFISTNRQTGLLGSYAVIQGGTHPDSLNVHGVGMALLHEVVPLSYPSQCVLNGPITLTRLAESSGWLIDSNTIRRPFETTTNWAAYTGNRSNAYWVPNKNVAYVHRAFASHSPPISLSSPVNETEVNPGASITITVNDASFTGWTNMAIYSFSTNLANFTSGTPSFTMVNVQSGMHVFSAIATRGGTNVTTRPILVYVRKTTAPSYPCTGGTIWYASTNGLAGNTGAIGSPWDLQTALTKTGVVLPGDRIRLRGGNYTHAPQGVVTSPCCNEGYIFQATLSGTSNAKIIIESYPGEWAMIDGGAFGAGAYAYHANTRPTLLIGSSSNPALGKYLRFQNLEIYSSSTEQRTSGTDFSFPPDISRSDGYYSYGIGSDLVNCVIHDVTAGISSFPGGSGNQGYDQTYYGNVTYNNGWLGTPHNHGHGFYMQQYPNLGIKIVKRNVAWGNYDRNMQINGSGTSREWSFRISENLNIGWQGVRGTTLMGTSTGSANRVGDFQFTDNFGYSSDLSLYEEADADAYVDLIATGNYFAHSFLQVSSWQQAIITNNTFISPSLGKVVSLRTNDIYLPWTYDFNRYVISNLTYQAFRTETQAPVNFAGWKSSTGYDQNSTVEAAIPITNYVILQNNAFDANRAQLFIYNWKLDSSVTVDLASLGWGVGANVLARNVQNYFTDTVNLVISGANTIVLNMTAVAHTVAIPFGDTASTIPKTFPYFGAFILQKTGPTVEPPPPNFTTTISSLNPSTGVAITVTPVDLGGLGNGTTTFTRTNSENVVVALTAPASASGNAFTSWTRNGVLYSSSTGISYTNVADTAFAAVFATPAPPSTNYTVTISSVNPNTGTAITVSPADNGGLTSGTTMFLRTNIQGRVTTLTAPATSSGNNFSQWDRNGILYATTLAITFTNISNVSLTAVYSPPPPPPNFVSAYNAFNPTDVKITITPVDNGGFSSDQTPFTRTNIQGVVTSISAENPALLNGNSFLEWQLNGVFFSTNFIVSYTNNANTTWLAVYTNAFYLVTVNSTGGTDCLIDVFPADREGFSFGITPFTRTYFRDQVIIVTSAIADKNGAAMTGWLFDGSPFTFGTSAIFTNNAPHTLTAVYEVPTPGPVPNSNKAVTRRRVPF